MLIHLTYCYMELQIVRIIHTILDRLKVPPNSIPGIKTPGLLKSSTVAAFSKQAFEVLLIGLAPRDPQS